MKTGVNVFNHTKGERGEEGTLDNYAFFQLESELGAGKRCFNCEFCGDIESETGLVKDAIIDCLGNQAGIENIRLEETCGFHKYVEDYHIAKKLY